ncbi:MAG TPA: hypothetical protein VN493_11835 [Thermoanaerobaculia bacterium]|nr:hypothetical protein [Thermoanaerobaculia bacterium]
MPRRYEALLEPTSLPVRPAVALRTALRRGYGREDLRVADAWKRSRVVAEV